MVQTEPASLPEPVSLMAATEAQGKLLVEIVVDR